MRIALCTMLNDAFIPGYIAFIKSITKHNFIDYDFIVLDSNLSGSAKKIINAYYNKIIFRKINYNKYNNVNFSKTADSLKETFYKLDIFSIREYDRVVFFDMDMIVMGDICEVLGCCADIAAVNGYNPGGDCLRGDINSGLLVLNKNVLNNNVYNSLIAIAEQGHSMPDQKTINGYFQKNIFILPKKYNVEKRMFYTQKMKDVLNDIRILHFVAKKPWLAGCEDKDYSEYEKLWRSYYNG